MKKVFVCCFLFCFLFFNSLALAGSFKQRSTVSWYVTNGKKPAKQNSFIVPGIGKGLVVCGRSQQYIRIVPNNLTSKTSLWTTKYYYRQAAHSYVEVKTSVADEKSFYPFAQENIRLNLGKNQGYLYGVITNRDNIFSSQVSTYIFVNWLQYSGKCWMQVKAVSEVTENNNNYVSFKTKNRSRFYDFHDAYSMNLNFGRQNSLPKIKKGRLPGFGFYELRCKNKPYMIIKTKTRASAWVETSQGKGTNTVIGKTFYPRRQIMGPIKLSYNGMSHIKLQNSKQRVQIDLASLKTRSGCEINGLAQLLK